MKALFKLILLLMFTASVYSQEGTDKLVMLNGQTKEGKVTAINSDNVKFVHKGETLEYEFKKAEINKIVFASGREEVFSNKQSAQQQTLSNPADRRNKLAVLPFGFTTNDNNLLSEDMSHRMQGDCAEVFRTDASMITVQDPMETNAILVRNNINESNIAAMTPKEIALLLGVEYVVYGNGNVVNKGSQTFGSGVSTYEDKNKKQNNSKGSTVTTNSSTTIVNYSTDINLKIYNDKGDNIFSNTRNSFGSTLDSYKATIKYMVKRTPFGSKGN